MQFSHKPVTLFYPVDGAQIHAENVSFKWTDMDIESVKKYILLVNEYNHEKNNWVPLEGGGRYVASADSYFLVLKKAGSFRWKIVAKNHQEKEISKTDWYHFKLLKKQISLLYSCATENAIYKMLTQTSDIILYKGSPYHQKSYAFGIAKHVGPVSGWQSPTPKVNTLEKKQISSPVWTWPPPVNYTVIQCNTARTIICQKNQLASESRVTDVRL